jgi:hypothetical protein
MVLLPSSKSSSFFFFFFKVLSVCWIQQCTFGAHFLAIGVHSKKGKKKFTRPQLCLHEGPFELKE